VKAVKFSCKKEKIIRFFYITFLADITEACELQNTFDFFVNCNERASGSEATEQNTKSKNPVEFFCLPFSFLLSLFHDIFVCRTVNALRVSKLVIAKPIKMSVKKRIRAKIEY